MLAQIISRELERRHLASDVVLSERKPMVGQLILKAIDPARSLLTLQDIKTFLSNLCLIKSNAEIWKPYIGSMVSL